MTNPIIIFPQSQPPSNVYSKPRGVIVIFPERVSKLWFSFIKIFWVFEKNSKNIKLSNSIYPTFFYNSWKQKFGTITIYHLGSLLGR